jgi:hypothetical protein
MCFVSGSLYAGMAGIIAMQSGSLCSGIPDNEGLNLLQVVQFSPESLVQFGLELVVQFTPDYTLSM